MDELALVQNYLLVGAMLFGIGLVGFFSRRNPGAVDDIHFDGAVVQPGDKGQRPGAFSRLLLHTPLVGWSGSGGGVSQCGDEKSKNSSMSSAVASRAVSGATLKRTSINFRIEVTSRQT